MYKVTAPTLLIVEGLDGVVVTLNQKAYNLPTCEKRLEVVPGASHLFEQKGKQEEVADISEKWFGQWFNAKTEQRVQG